MSVDSQNNHILTIENINQKVYDHIQSGIDAQKEFSYHTDLFNVATEIINRSGLTAEQSDTYLKEVNQKYNTLDFNLPCKLGECYYRLITNSQFDKLPTELQEEISAKLVGITSAYSKQIQTETQRGHDSFLFPALNAINLLVPILQTQKTNETIKQTALTVINKLKGEPDMSGNTDSTYKKLDKYITTKLPMLSPYPSESF